MTISSDFNLYWQNAKQDLVPRTSLDDSSIVSIKSPVSQNYSVLEHGLLQHCGVQCWNPFDSSLTDSWPPTAPWALPWEEADFSDSSPYCYTVAVHEESLHTESVVSSLGIPSLVLLSGAKACKCLPTAVRFALIHFFSRKDISSSQSYMSYVGHRWNEKAEKIMRCGLLLELKELGFTLGHYVQASQPFWVNSSWL